MANEAQAVKVMTSFLADNAQDARGNISVACSNIRQGKKSVGDQRALKKAKALAACDEAMAAVFEIKQLAMQL